MRHVLYAVRNGMNEVLLYMYVPVYMPVYKIAYIPSV